MKSVTFSKDYEVLSRHADPNGRLSVWALISMLFDAADLHAAQWRVSLGQLAEGRPTWVLSRLHLRMKRHPAWDEPVRVMTWPSGARRILAGRDFALNVADERVGVASTLWLMIDRETRRPVGLPDFVKSFVPPPESPVVKTRAKWDEPNPTTEPAESVEVSWHDLDLNRHASAGSYVNWLLHSVPPQCRETSALSELDILFKSEAFLGDSVGIHLGESTDTDGGLEYTHLVRRKDDAQVLASGRSVWLDDGRQVSG